MFSALALSMQQLQPAAKLPLLSCLRRAYRSVLAHVQSSHAGGHQQLRLDLSLLFDQLQHVGSCSRHKLVQSCGDGAEGPDLG
jgi:hypothetical protein